MRSIHLTLPKHHHAPLVPPPSRLSAIIAVGVWFVKLHKRYGETVLGHRMEKCNRLFRVEKLPQLHANAAQSLESCTVQHGPCITQQVDTNVARLHERECVAAVRKLDAHGACCYGVTPRCGAQVARRHLQMVTWHCAAVFCARRMTCTDRGKRVEHTSGTQLVFAHSSARSLAHGSHLATARARAPILPACRVRHHRAPVAGGPASPER